MRACRLAIGWYSRCCALLGIFIIAMSAAAIADKEYPTSIINDSGSPVRLTNCELWARDANKTVLYTHVSIPNALIDVGIAFANSSSATVTVIRVKLEAYDAFNTLLKEVDIDSTSNRSADKMSVASGSSFDLLGPRSWHFRNDTPSLDHVSCEISAVKFSDGTVWTLGASAPRQSPKTRATGSGSQDLRSARRPRSGRPTRSAGVGLGATMELK